jgi:SAM-dependent methyltransferase
MARLPDRSRYRDCPISDEHDPLRFHYWPVLGRLYRRRIDGCVRLLGSGARVLDVGYGSGTSFLELGDRFEEVHGLDTHDYGPAIARVFAQEGLAVRLERGTILDPPYPDATFDAVLAMSVLEHLRPGEQPQAMRQAHRLLRPGGVLVVGVPGLNAMMTLAFRLMGVDIRRHHFSSPDVVLAAAGERFGIERVVRQPSWAPAGAVTYVWFKGRRV